MLQENQNPEMEQEAVESAEAAEAVENVEETENVETEMTVEETVAALTKAYAKLQAEKEAADAQLLRMQADFDNFRRRTRQEKDEWRVQNVVDYTGELLPVIDNFERAVGALKQTEMDANHLMGIEMISRQLVEVLGNKGVQKIPTVGTEFDPKCHEAIAQAIVEDDAQVGIITDEVQAGYKVGEKIIRVAMVRVGAK